MGAAYFRTFTGRHVYPLDPKPDQISIFDVAHALSQICRFVGHTTALYSVAQHSVLVSQHVPPGDALWGLLHDASEAYLCDLPSPIKRDPEMGIYRIAEDRLMLAVCERYGLAPEMQCSVKLADRLLLATEFRDVTTMDDMDWVLAECGCKPLADYTIQPWTPSIAEKAFLDRFEELTA